MTQEAHKLSASPRHFLSTKDLRKEEVLELFRQADEYLPIVKNENPAEDVLKGHTVINLFFEDSTRTRISFDLAAKKLGANTVHFSSAGSSVSKGEGLRDTAQTLAAYAPSAFVMRHSDSGSSQRLAEAGWTDVPVVNAGDGAHEHPTQAMLDAYTLYRHWGPDFSGKRVAIVGDIFHSRVVRSNIYLLQTLGAEVILVGPATLVPESLQKLGVTISNNLDSTLENGLDAIMLLRVQKERMNQAFFPSLDEYTRFWGLTPERYEALGKHTIVMHPGPMNRGIEICDEAADGKQSVILEQVTNGAAIRMAILHKVILGEES